jgi:hypothetical protein
MKVQKNANLNTISLKDIEEKSPDNIRAYISKLIKNNGLEELLNDQLSISNDYGSRV